MTTAPTNRKPPSKAEAPQEPLKRAVDIKRRAYDQLRVHLVAGHTLADRAKRRR